MAFKRSYKKRVARKRRPVAKRRPYYARKRVARRRRNYRQIALRSVDNTRKFHAKVYEQFVLPWHLPANEPSPGIGSWTRFQRDLLMGLFFEKNPQMSRNLIEYQWCKFNYIAVKIRELNYYGFLTTIRQAENIDISGMTSVDFNHLPMYFAWDIDQDMSFNEADGAYVTVDPESLTQYPGTKKMFPGKKRPITFLWRVPMVWRQYFNTVLIRNTPGVNTIGRFLQDVSNVSSVRFPRKLMATHQNIFFDADLPQGGGGIKGKTVFAVTYHLGVTFKGRGVSGITKTLSTRYQHKPDIEVIEDVPADEVNLDCMVPVESCEYF